MAHLGFGVPLRFRFPSPTVGLVCVKLRNTDQRVVGRLVYSISRHLSQHLPVRGRIARTVRPTPIAGLKSCPSMGIELRAGHQSLTMLRRRSIRTAVGQFASGGCMSRPLAHKGMSWWCLPLRLYIRRDDAAGHQTTEPHSRPCNACCSFETVLDVCKRQERTVLI